MEWDIHNTDLRRDTKERGDMVDGNLAKVEIMVETRI